MRWASLWVLHSRSFSMEIFLVKGSSFSRKWAGG